MLHTTLASVLPPTLQIALESMVLEAGVMEIGWVPGKQGSEWACGSGLVYLPRYLL